jgi:hypothetical protein
MAIPALLLPLLGQLASNGFQTVAEAIQAKGKQFVEEKLGVELKPNMTAAELALLRTATMQHEAELTRICEQAITDRHKNDMASDSWLSKNVRPISLVYLMALFTLAFVIAVPESVLTMLRDLLMAVFMFYFGSRTIEKVVHSVKGAGK